MSNDIQDTPPRSSNIIPSPEFPPSRICYESLYGDRWFDSPAEFAAWKAEPLWRRMCLLTAHDRKMKSA